MRARLVSIALLLAATPARADESVHVARAHSLRESPSGISPPERTKPGYLQLFATSLLGDGLRFNNPYRLSTVLGSSAESLSRTSAYVDLGVAATTGSPLGFQHGLALRMSLAIEGVPETVMTPSYVLYRRWRDWAAIGRAGVALAVRPDVTWGGELSAGGAYFFRGGLAAMGELAFDLFYGAGTREVGTPAYPVVSAQLGILVAWEILP
jgi:hypothetical protein